MVCFTRSVCGFAAGHYAGKMKVLAAYRILKALYKDGRRVKSGIAIT